MRPQRAVLCNTARMGRFLLTSALPPTVLDAPLPAGTQRLWLSLNAPQPGTIARAQATALWQALRAQENACPSLKYHLALHPGPFEAGALACWLRISAASQRLLLDAVRVFDVLLRQHVPVFAQAGNAACAQSSAILLEELERRNGWRLAISDDLELLREQLKGVPWTSRGCALGGFS